jgi:hypothetical protein
VDLEKCFLGEIFSKREISNHAHANCENAPLVLKVEFRECVVVSCLGTSDNLGLTESCASLEGFASERRNTC